MLLLSLRSASNYSGGYQEGVSCTEVRVRVIFAACNGVVGSSLLSSLRLTLSKVMPVCVMWTRTPTWS